MNCTLPAKLLTVAQLEPGTIFLSREWEASRLCISTALPLLNGRHQALVLNHLEASETVTAMAMLDPDEIALSLGREWVLDSKYTANLLDDGITYSHPPVLVATSVGLCFKARPLQGGAKPSFIAIDGMTDASHTVSSPPPVEIPAFSIYLTAQAHKRGDEPIFTSDAR